jgi:hypothetical protein
MSGRVRVEMRRTGGFTGRPLQVSLDTARMPPADAERLRELVSTADLTGLGPAREPTAGADLMRYDLTVEHSGSRWSGTVADPDIPPGLRPLLQFLTAARPGA